MDTNVPVDREPVDGGGFARLIAELRQWHVFRIAAAYGVIAWLIVQVVATVGPAFNLSTWVLRAVVLATIVGFLATMAFLLFTPRSVGRGRQAAYLSSRARVLAGAGVVLIAAAAGAWSIRSLSAREHVSVAVLPFADLSPSRDKAYFAEGIAEEILSGLAAQKDIKVLGRTSASQIQRNPDPKAVRASLGVTHLLEGSTRTSGNDLRVNVRLIDTSDGSQLWEEEYRGAVSDVFKVQDQIATTVVKRLRGTFFAGDVHTAKPAALDAYEAYLAARAIIRENKRESIERAWRMARQIVEEHPRYAPGHALFAETTILLSNGFYGYGDLPLAKARRIALPHAQEAIRLAPDRAEGYAAIGLVLPEQQSIAPYRKALAIDPSRADVRLRLALAYDVLKRTDDAFPEYREAVESEPLAPAFINRYIQILGSSGQTDEALRVIDQFVRRGGSEAQAWRFRGAVYAYRNDFSRAVLARQRSLQLDPGLPYQRDWLIQYLHFLGLDEWHRPYRTGSTDYIRTFGNEDRGALKTLIARDGSTSWYANGFPFALFSLGRSREWASIAALYDKRPPDLIEICALRPTLAPLIGMALLRQGRDADAGKLLDCTQKQISRLLAMRYRSPDDMPGELEASQAALLAVRSDRRALDWLDKAVQRGWLGQYYSASLADWPQFDVLQGDPRYAVIQERIDATVTRERAKVIASSNRRLASS